MPRNSACSALGRSLRIQIFVLHSRTENSQISPPMKIALDAMGGDFGPPNLVGGAVMALREYPHIDKLFLVGDTAADRSRAEESTTATTAESRSCIPPRSSR